MEHPLERKQVHFKTPFKNILQAIYYFFPTEVIPIWNINGQKTILYYVYQSHRHWNLYSLATKIKIIPSMAYLKASLGNNVTATWTPHPMNTWFRLQMWSLFIYTRPSNSLHGKTVKSKKPKTSKEISSLLAHTKWVATVKKWKNKMC